MAGIGLPNSGLPPSVPIRIVHPVTGVVDVVVVHSSPADIMPEARKLLSGRPIYSVYLKVGTPKEWVLQYCVPDTPARASGRVIQLGNPTPLQAPYPKLTILPPLASLVRDKRTILHGYLNDTGQFRALMPVAAEDQEFFSRIASLVNQWDFRPAVRGGKPVEIELLLVIPPLQ